MSAYNKVRVGIITANHFPRIGGMEYVTHELARALDKIPETSVAVACSTMRDVSMDFPYPYTLYRAKSFSIFTSYLHQKNMENMIQRERINVLHGQMLHGSGEEAVTIGRKYNLPVIAASHGADLQYVPEIGYGARLQPQLKAKVAFSIKYADKILVLSRFNRDLAIELGASAEKVVIVPNGVLYEEIGAVPFKNVRNEYGLKPDDFVIITVGRNRPIKRMDLLYQALSLIKNEAPAIKCLSVGPKENLAELAGKHGLEDTVILSGPITAQSANGYILPPFPNLINLYRAADLFISVSYMESFNISALDALACGTPILISMKQGIRDVMIEGENGFTLEDETPEGLAEMLLQISRRRFELKEKREKIRQSISHLTWNNVAKRLRKIYRSLLI